MTPNDTATALTAQLNKLWELALAGNRASGDLEIGKSHEAFVRQHAELTALYDSIEPDILAEVQNLMANIADTYLLRATSARCWADMSNTLASIALPKPLPAEQAAAFMAALENYRKADFSAARSQTNEIIQELGQLQPNPYLGIDWYARLVAIGDGFVPETIFNS